MKTIKDLSVFKKGWLMLKSRAQRLRTINRINTTLFDQGDQTRSRIKIPLFKLDSPQCLLEWNVKSDREYGGDSEGELAYTGNSLRLSGHIDTKDANRLLYPPCVGMKVGDESSHTNLRYFNMINLKVKTNGDVFRVILNLEIPWVGDYTAQALIVTQSREWEELEIPINCFQGRENFIFDSNLDQLTTLNDCMFTYIEIIQQSQVDRDVDLQIRELNLVYQKDAPLFASRFKRKTFIRPLRNYGSPGIVNDGRDAYHVK